MRKKIANKNRLQVSGAVLSLFIIVLFSAKCGINKKRNNETSGEITKKITTEEADYKKNYEHKIKVIKQTDDVLNRVVNYLKTNHYEKYPSVKSLVDDAFVQLNKAKMAKEKYIKYEKEAKWKDAFIWAEQYWQYQVKAADFDLRAKKLLDEKLAQNK